MNMRNYSISLIAYIITFVLHMFFIVNPLNNFTDGLLAGGFIASGMIWILTAWKSKPDGGYIAVFAVVAFIFGQIGTHYSIPFMKEIAMLHVAIVAICIILKLTADAEKKNAEDAEDEQDG